jgi:2-polyprenyl-6-methoxyphenol hydroxylase-like FAD-dependent oxidoreductase
MPGEDVVADTEVLIAGAGPTGLALALWLAHRGVRFRIVDKIGKPGTTSRALAVHARTLELYQQLGLVDAVLERGLAVRAVNLWIKGRRVAHVDFGEIGRGTSRYSHVIMFAQDEHERLLIDRLSALGVTIERPVALTGFDDRGDRIVARLQHGDGREETCEAAFLAGCDGARSLVREVLKVGFPGSTYANVFYVADSECSGPIMDRELHVAIDEGDFIAAFPIKGDKRVRLVGVVETEENDPKLTWDDVGRVVISRLGVDVERINWFSTYRVHHRVVSHFRVGRAFLCGDAAHIHSPVGGQGMNTGIGDAFNLAWKLAAVTQSRADSRLLDTYDPERSAFARKLVATTDRVFELVTSDGPIATFVRLNVVPRVAPLLARREAVRRFMFRTISQTAIEYRASALSNGSAGHVQSGDRLPWIDLDGRGDDNYMPLSSLDWQVHVYGDAPDTLASLCRERRLPLHAFAWRDAMERAGLARNAPYLIRPDGYVGYSAADGDPTKLASYLDQWSIRSAA